MVIEKPTINVDTNEPIGAVPGALKQHREYNSHRGRLILNSFKNGTDIPEDLEAIELEHPLVIFSEHINIPQKISVKGLLGLYTYTASLPPGDGAVLLQCNGEDGSQQPSTGSPSAASSLNGSDGGRIELFLENVNEVDFDRVHFDVSGGKGSHESSGLKRKGVGGAGGTIDIMFGGRHTHIIALGRSILDNQGLTSTPETAIENFVWRQSALQHFVEMLLNHLEAGPSQALLRPLESLMLLIGLQWDSYPLVLERSALRDILFQIDGEPQQLLADAYLRADARGGLTLGDVYVDSEPARGKQGKIDLRYYYSLPNQITSGSIAIVHPEQCAMLVERIKLEYYTRADLQATGELLEQLRQRLCFLDWVREGDDVHLAYAAAEQYMCLRPEPTSRSTGGLIAIRRLKLIKQQADLLALQMSTHVDFFGHALNFVPRLSHTYLSETFNKMLGLLKDVEEANSIYSKAGQSRSVMRQQLAALRLAAQEKLRQLRIDIGGIAEKVQDLASAAHTLGTKLDSLREVVEKKMKQASHLIDDLQVLPGIGIADVLSAVAMVVLTPGDLSMKAATAAYVAPSLIINAIANAGVKSEQGTLVDKALIVENYKPLEGDVSACIEAYMDFKSSGSMANPEDPAGEKLIASKAALMSLLKQFKTAITAGNVENLDRAFDEFVGAVLDRNSKILQYNLALGNYAQALTEIDYYADQLTLISEQALQSGQYDPSIPTLSLFFERAYADSMWTVLELLYETERALQFRFLTNKTFVGTIIGESEQINSAVLSRVSIAMLNIFRNGLESEGISPTSFESKRYYLTAAELLELRQSKDIVVRIAPLEKGQMQPGNDFHGMAAVRVNRVRFFMIGAASPTDLIRVKLTHLGQETFVRVSHGGSSKRKLSTIVNDGKDKGSQSEANPIDALDMGVGEALIQFVHRPADVEFTYKPSVAKFDPSDNGVVDGDLMKTVGDPFAPMGPFTSWRVDCSEYNEGLDLHKVTEAFFEFRGLFHTN